MIENIGELVSGDVIYDCTCINNFQLYILKIIKVKTMNNFSAEVTCGKDAELFDKIDFGINRFTRSPIEAYCFYIQNH
jgi:hypothetical protein